MRYDRLLADAWRLTWQNRWLWLFGLFAGSAGIGYTGSSGNFNRGSVPPSTRGGQEPDFQQISNEITARVTAFIAEHAALIATIMVGVLVVAFVLFLVSLLCQGAVIGGAADLAEGRPAGGGASWGHGLRAFWPLLLLHLLVLLVWLVVLALLGALVVLPLLSGDGPNVGPRLLGLLALLPLFALLGNVVGVFISFAQRAIVLDGAGPLEGLGQAWGLVRGNLVPCIVIWLLGIVAAILGGIAVGVVALLALIPSGIIAGIGFLIVGTHAGVAPLAPFIGVAAVLWLAVLLVGLAGLNTFQWVLWTLAYLRLTGRALPPAAAPAV